MEILKISRRIQATVQLEASHKERHEELTAHSSLRIEFCKARQHNIFNNLKGLFVCFLFVCSCLFVRMGED